MWLGFSGDSIRKLGALSPGLDAELLGRSV